MSTITYTPDAPIEHTGPIGRVWTPGGVVARDTHGPIEWTTFDRRPPGSNQRQQAVGARDVRTARGQAIAAARLRTRPDFHVIGWAVPYDKVLPSDRGERLVFSAATEWGLDDPYIGLELEHHGAYLGVAKVIEHDAGLYVDGNVPAPRVKALDGRHQLSVGISNMTTRPTRSGVLEVISARLDEVSLCRHARWAPWTDAAVIPIAA